MPTVRRATFIALVVLSAIVAVVGVWSFRRDEYPFRFTQEQIVAVRVESLKEPLPTGFLGTPAPELADWVDSMERESGDIPPDPLVRLVVDLNDGRRLQLDVGPDVSLGSWTGGPQAGRPAIRLATEADLYWYVRGVFDALRGG
ncbi:MAG TPA: hypothetical protein VJ787_00740 [Thermoleophilia bacterium]|nr:hypothetical protein [Thermoleophilia bacterium]